MVMATGEGCNPPATSSWFVQNNDHRTNTASLQPLQESQFIGADILWALDAQGVFTLFEGQRARDFYLTEKIVGSAVYDVFKHYPTLVDAAGKGLAGGQIDTTLELAGMRWEIRGYPLRDDAGEVSSLVGVANQIVHEQAAQSDQNLILGFLDALREARHYAEMPEIILRQATLLLEPDNVLLAVEDDSHLAMQVEAASGQWKSLIGQRIRLLDSTRTASEMRNLIQEHTPAILNENGEKNVIGIPLVAQDNLIGTLWVSRHQPYLPEGFQLLGVLGEMAASAIHRARQMEATQHRLQRLAALHDIDRAITHNTDLKVTLNIILGYVVGQLKVDAAAILLLNTTNQRIEYAAGTGFTNHRIRSTSIRMDACNAGQVRMAADLSGMRKIFKCKDICLPLDLFELEGFTTHFGTPLVIRGQVKGVLELFNRSELDPDDEWFSFLETLATQTAIAVDNTELFNGLQLSNTELTLAYETALEGWVRALDLRDEETEWHTRRVTEMTLHLASAIGVDSSELIDIRRGALLHDIGKMGISDRILNKNGPLSQDEWSIMKRHPVYARDLLTPITYLHSSIEIPYYHHEKWDGSGYPEGLKADTIPLSARIFAVVDVWDALCSDRPYRKAWPVDQARQYLRDQSGKHFDPQVVEKFFELGMDRWNEHPTS
jgi:HD-GYP domain-containing protein (c-di-GMP phosphodiesterase class II)